jgi:hypothetical protein
MFAISPQKLFLPVIVLQPFRNHGFLLYHPVARDAVISVSSAVV